MLIGQLLYSRGLERQLCWNFCVGKEDHTNGRGKLSTGPGGWATETST